MIQSSYIAGRHGRNIHIQTDVVPSAEECAIAQEEARTKAKQQYVRDKAEVLNRGQDAKCFGINCPAGAIHTTGELNRRKLVTRGSTGKLCLGCGQ